MLLAIATAAFIATLLGGLLALGIKDRHHLILGFSAGAVIGVALFDLLPEALELTSSSYELSITTGIIALGFGLYMLLDRLIVLHHHHEDSAVHYDSHRASLGAGSLTLHSFLDGVGLGLAFKVSPAVGLIVAAAVLAHDFSDGINTVNMIRKNAGSRRSAYKWLFLDAIAPVVGVLATFYFTVSESTLGLLLALFCGFFLYIGASELVPESHHTHPVRWTTISTLVGMAVMYLVVRLVS